MLDASFAPRLLRLLLVVALAIGAAGCTSSGSGTASFAWPADVACPAQELAALYIPGYADSSSCSGLVSVDGPGAHTADGCAYPVTVETDNLCHFGE